MARPKTGETKIRHVRVPDHIWNAALEKARATDSTVTEVIVRALYRYAFTTPRTERADPEPETPTPAAP